MGRGLPRHAATPPPLPQIAHAVHPVLAAASRRGGAYLAASCPSLQKLPSPVGSCLPKPPSVQSGARGRATQASRTRCDKRGVRAACLARASEQTRRAANAGYPPQRRDEWRNAYSALALGSRLSALGSRELKAESPRSARALRALATRNTRAGTGQRGCIW